MMPKRVRPSWLMELSMLFMVPAQAQDEPKPLLLNELEADGEVEWVEIRNTSDQVEGLEGYTLTVEKVRAEAKGGKFAFDFPSWLSVPGRGFFVACFGGVPPGDNEPECPDLFCRGPDDRTLCVPFDLDRDGGIVSLGWKPPCKKVDLQIVDSILYPPLAERTGFGRARGAGAWCILEVNTPREENPDCPTRSRSILINEVSTALSVDWIEVFWNGKPGDPPVSLDGAILRNREDHFEFPIGAGLVLQEDTDPLDGCDTRFAVVVMGGSKAILNAMLDGVPCMSRILESPYGLKAEGESLVLEDALGEDLDRVFIPGLGPGELLARTPSGGPLRVTRSPSPNASNPEQVSNLPPSCEVIDRFPIKVTPGIEVTVYAKVLDRDSSSGHDDLESVDLLVKTNGQGGVTELSMRPGKRVYCERGPDPGIFVVELAAPDAEADLTYWVRARDKAGNVVECPPEELHVQPLDWTDPGGAHLLRINEVSANDSSPTGDWVEIYNHSGNQAFLLGMVFTDSILRRNDRELPGVVIDPHSFIRISLSDSPDAPRPVLPIALDDCRDEAILIHADEKTVIDAVLFHEEKTDLTLGRLPDGGDTLTIMRPTPGAPNASASCFLFDNLVPDSPLVINEVCSDNWTVAHDLGDEFGDWVEIYNRSGEEQRLDCWSLSDSWTEQRDMPPEGPDPWPFPAGLTIPPRGHLLVWCDNDDDCEPLSSTGEVHTNFQLNRRRDFVQLIDPCGDVVDYVVLGFEPRDIVVGRFPDGSGSGAFLKPTPGSANEPLTQEHPHLPIRLCAPVPVEARIGARACDARCARFRRGDANADCRVDIADAVFALRWLFLGGPVPDCQDAADSTDDGKTNITDPIYMLEYLFIGGPPLPDPGPDTPGPDPTDDELPACLEVAC